MDLPIKNCYFPIVMLVYQRVRRNEDKKKTRAGSLVVDRSPMVASGRHFWQISGSSQ